MICRLLQNLAEHFQKFPVSQKISKMDNSFASLCDPLASGSPVFRVWFVRSRFAALGDAALRSFSRLLPGSRRGSSPRRSPASAAASPLGRCGPLASGSFRSRFAALGDADAGLRSFSRFLGFSLFGASSFLLLCFSRVPFA